MIKKIENLPDVVFGFEFSGHITADDYEKIIFPEIETQKKRQPKLKIICHFTSDVRIDFGAMWDDTLVGIKNYFDWQKIAIVSDISWLNYTFKAMNFLLPGHMKIFPEKEKQKAIEWLSQ